MELPFCFPDPLEQAARRADEFQRLPREARWREIAALMEFGLAMTRQSAQRDWIEQRFAEQEAEWQRRQRELFAAHAR